MHVVSGQIAAVLTSCFDISIFYILEESVVKTASPSQSGQRGCNGFDMALQQTQYVVVTVYYSELGQTSLA